MNYASLTRGVLGETRKRCASLRDRFQPGIERRIKPGHRRSTSRPLTVAELAEASPPYRSPVIFSFASPRNDYATRESAAAKNEEAKGRGRRGCNRGDASRTFRRPRTSTIKCLICTTEQRVTVARRDCMASVLTSAGPRKPVFSFSRRSTLRKRA